LNPNHPGTQAQHGKSHWTVDVRYNNDDSTYRAAQRTEDLECRRSGCPNKKKEKKRKNHIIFVIAASQRALMAPKFR
jgi:hypothetical protein